MFIACVDEVKKEAMRRREKLLMSQRKSRRDAGIIELHNIKTTAKQELSELTAADRRKIIDVLLQRDEIFEPLYAMLFDGASPAKDRKRLLPKIES